MAGSNSPGPNSSVDTVDLHYSGAYEIVLRIGLSDTDPASLAFCYGLLASKLSNYPIQRINSYFNT